MFVVEQSSKNRDWASTWCKHAMTMAKRARSIESFIFVDICTKERNSSVRKRNNSKNYIARDAGSCVFYSLQSDCSASLQPIPKSYFSAPKFGLIYTDFLDDTEQLRADLSV